MGSKSPGCPVATRYHHRRCDGCRRARLTEGLSWEEFDATPFRRPVRPLAHGSCLVPGCESELLSRGLCCGRQRSWRKDEAEPVEAFMAQGPAAGPPRGLRHRQLGITRI